MASSSKQNWQLGDAGILRKKEEDEELLVFGYSCKLFRDDEKALYIDQGKHLIPWMGDDTLKIDRYDGRGALYDLKQYEPLPGGYDESLWVGLSDSERHVEHLCNEERYRALHHNEDEEALYQEKCDAQSTEGRAVRRRRQFHSDPSCCPVCGVTVRSSELHIHLEHEMEKLGKISKHRRLSEMPGPSFESSSTAANRHETYLKIKSNRTNRIRLKKPKPNQVKCPVCNVCIKGNSEELNRHVENCLQDQDEEVNVEGDDGSFTAYEWAGQERIRATTLLDGGYAGVGMSSVNRSNHVDDENELIVDVETYGPSQYSEADVVLTTAETPSEEAERMALRAAVIHADTNLVTPESRKNMNSDRCVDSSGNGTISPPHLEMVMDCDIVSEEQKKFLMSGNGCEVKDLEGTGTKFTVNTSNTVGSSSVDVSSKLVLKAINRNNMNKFSCSSSEVHSSDNTYIIKALMSRIVELEKMTPVKCLICLESYKLPVISVNCWHVYCEECWLHSLGAKKLCPQCNTITSPSDLRKIYI